LHPLLSNRVIACGLFEPGNPLRLDHFPSDFRLPGSPAPHGSSRRWRQRLLDPVERFLDRRIEFRQGIAEDLAHPRPARRVADIVPPGALGRNAIGQLAFGLGTFGFGGCFGCFLGEGIPPALRDARLIFRRLACGGASANAPQPPRVELIEGGGRSKKGATGSLLSQSGFPTRYWPKPAPTSVTSR
jgi:hypothetical protein